MNAYLYGKKILDVLEYQEFQGLDLIFCWCEGCKFPCVGLMKDVVLGD